MTLQASMVEVAGRQVFVIRTETDYVSDRVVIMAHGFRGDSTGPARTFVDFERDLLDSAFTCLRFDQPCSGNSPGDFIDSSFDAWVETLAGLAVRELEAGHRVAIFGQSMGATAAVVAAARPELRGRIACLLLWVPDPKSTWSPPEGAEFFEEGGQRYPAQFWTEARDARFFECLADFEGALHLVCGESDRFVERDLRRKVVAAVEARGGVTIELAGEDHSPWGYLSSRRIIDQELVFLERNIRRA